VDDVATEIDAIVAANGTRQRLLRIRLAHHHATSLGRVLAFPHHRNDWSRRDEVDEFVVKGLVLQIDVVLLDMFFRTLHKLHGDEFEASLFESLDDVADESSLDAVGFDHDEGAVRVRHLGGSRRFELRIEGKMSEKRKPQRKK